MVNPVLAHFHTIALREALAVVLAAARWGAADRDESLATAARVRAGDADSWLRECPAPAGAAWAAAPAGDPTRYLPAATYYGAAMAVIEETDGSVAEIDLWRRQRACWDRAVALAGGERLAIPVRGRDAARLFPPGAPGARPASAVRSS